MVADRKIISYVKSSLDAGVPLDKIRSELYNAGWPKKDIEEAMASAGAPGQRPAVIGNAPQEIKPGKQAGTGRPKSRKLLYGGVILVVLLGVGIFTYFTVLSLILPSNQPIIIPSNVTCNDGKCEGTETYENCPADCMASPSNADVAVNPQSKSVNSGDSVTFQIEVSGVSNLYGFQFNLNYDPSLLQFSSAQEGTFLKSSDTSTFCIEPKAVSGASGSYVSIACTRLGTVGGVNGNGLLESVTFSALNGGTAQPTVSNIKLVDSNAQKISISQ